MADGMIEVAKATVTIVPTMEGAQQQITEDLTGATDAAADKAGKSGGKKLGSSIGDSLGKVGSSMTKGITVPVAAAATASVAAWKSVDTAMDTIATKTGASGDALTDMQDRAKALATSIPTDFQSAGDAIGEVNTRFGLTGDSLSSLSEQFIKFAQINNQDVSGSVDSVSKVMESFGLSADDASGYLDALNVVGQKTGVDVGTLADSVSQNAAQFQQMGLSAEDATNLLGEMSMAGLDTSTGMTGLKKAMQAATKDGVSMNDKLKEFSDTMNSNASSTDKLQAAYDLFGDRAGAAIYNAVSTGQLSLTDMTGSLTDFSGSVSSTFENTQDPLDQFTVVMNQLKESGAGLVDTMAPMITQVLGTMSDVLTNIKTAWDNLSPSTQQGIIEAVMVAAAIGPVIAGISKCVGIIGGLQSAIGLLSNPVALVVAAVVAAVILIVTHFDQIKEAFGKVKDFIADKAQAIGDFFHGLGDKAGEMKDAVVDKFQAIKDGAVNKFNAMKSSVASIFNAVKTAITKPIEAARDAVKGVVDKITGFFAGMHLSLPHINLPHFSITGKLSLNPPSVPHLSIDWYDKGGIFASPTVIGVGEKRPEFVGALDDLRGIVRDEADGASVVSAVNAGFGKIETIMQQYFPEFANTEVRLDSDTLVGSISSKMDGSLGSRTKMAKRGLAY